MHVQYCTYTSFAVGNVATHAQSDLRARWSNACRAGLYAQGLGLAAGCPILAIFYTKIALETISEGPKIQYFYRGMASDPLGDALCVHFRTCICSTAPLIKGNMLPTALYWCTTLHTLAH